MNVTSLKLSATNSFVVWAQDNCVLVDTGYEGNWAVFRTTLRKVDVELAQISHIILTHHHDDHSGLLHNILRENESIPVVMSHLCKDLILQGKNDVTYDGGYVN